MAVDRFEDYEITNRIDEDTTPTGQRDIPVNVEANAILPIAKYTGHGIKSFSKYDEGISYAEANSPYGFEKRRHEEQGVFAQLGSALNQAIVGEIVGGTIEGSGYLADMPQYVRLLRGTEKEFHNGLSDFGKSLREWSQETTPIYSDPFKEGQFAPEEFSWWMSHLPSVASTLSLLIPSGAAVRGLSWAGKLARETAAGGKLGKFAMNQVNNVRAMAKAAPASAEMVNWAAGGVTQAIISRHMEGLMEAAGVHDGLKEELTGKVIGPEQINSIKVNYGIDIPTDENGYGIVDENTANEIGARAAANTYKADWAMILQDIPQYLMLRTPFGKSSEALTSKMAKFLGQSTVAPIVNRTQAIIKDAIGEGFEEGYQYVSSERSRERALTDAGLYEKRDTGSAISDYMGRGEFWTSAFFGALGAGVVQTAGKGINNAIAGIKGLQTTDEARLQNLVDSSKQFKAYLTLQSFAEQTKNPSLANSISDKHLVDVSTNAMEHGNAEALISFLESTEKMSPKEAKELNLPEDFAEQAKKKNPNLIKDIKKIAENYDSAIKSHTPEFAGMIAKHQFLAEKHDGYSKDFQKAYDFESNVWADNDRLSSGYKRSFQIQNYELPVREAIIADLESERKIAEKNKDTKKAEFLSEKIKRHVEVLDALDKESSDAMKSRTATEKNDDKTYRDAKKTLIKAQPKTHNGKVVKIKQVDAINSLMAPKGQDAVNSLANSLFSKETADSNMYSAKESATEEFQTKWKDSANKKKAEDLKNAADAAKTKKEADAQKARAAANGSGSEMNTAHQESAGRAVYKNTGERMTEADFGTETEYVPKYDAAADALINGNDKAEKKPVDKKAKNGVADQEEVEDEENVLQFEDDNYEISDEDSEEPSAQVGGEENTERLLQPKESIKSEESLDQVDFGTKILADSGAAIQKFVDDIKQKFNKSVDKTFDKDEVAAINARLDDIDIADDVDDFLTALLAFPQGKSVAVTSMKKIAGNEMKTTERTAIASIQDNQSKNSGEWIDTNTITNPENITTSGSSSDHYNATKSDGEVSAPEGAIRRLIHFFKPPHTKTIASHIWSQNMAGTKYKSHPNYKVFEQIDQDALNSGKYPVGSTIYFEIDHSINNGDSVMVVIEFEGKSNVIGMLDPYSEGEDRRFLDEILDDIKTIGNKGIIRSNLTSQISGYAAKYTKTKERHTPLKIMSKAQKDKHKSIGGFRLGYTKFVGGRMRWFVPQQNADSLEMGSGVQYAGQIGLVIDNVFSGEAIPMFGFVKKFTEYTTMGAKQKAIATKIMKQANDILQELDENNEKDILARLKQLLILPKQYRKEGLSYLKANPTIWKEALLDSTINIDIKKINTEQKDYHGVLSDKLVTYNEAISDFLAFNIQPVDHFEDVAALLDGDLTTADPSIKKSVNKTTTTKKAKVDPEVKKSGKKRTPAKGVDAAIQKETHTLVKELKDEEIENIAVNDGDGSIVTVEAPVRRERKVTKFGLNHTNLIDEIRGNQNKDVRKRPAGEEDSSLNDKAAEIEWFKKAFPGVPLYILDDLKGISKNGPELWGAFTNSSVYIAKNAGTGTVYHEAFHVVFNLYLGSDKAKTIASQYAKDNKMKQPSSEDEYIFIEEAMADEFAEYINTRKKSKPANLLMNIFDRLMELIGFFIKQNDKNILYRKIANGFYKNAQVKPGIFGSLVLRAKPAGWSSVFSKEVAEAINQYIIFEIIPQYIEVGAIPSGYETAEALDYLIKENLLVDLYEEVYSGFSAAYDVLGEGETKKNLETVINNMFNKDGSFGFAINESLRAFDSYNKIKITGLVAKQTVRDDLEIDEFGQPTKENWMTSAHKRSAADNIPQQVRDFIRYLKVPGVKNAIGRDAYVDFSDSFHKLLLDTAGSVSSKEIVKKLKSVYDSAVIDGKYLGLNPEYKEVIEKLESDKVFAAQFFNVFSKQQANFTTIVYAPDGTFRIIDANRVGITNKIITDWKNSASFDSKIISTDKDGKEKIDVKRAKELLDQFHKLQGTKNIESFKKMSQIVLEFGIDIPVEVFQYAYNNRHAKSFNTSFVGPLAIALTSFTNGINPFDPDVETKEGFKGEMKMIRRLADIVKYATPSLYESSFRNIENETVYTHLVPNALSTLIHRLTDRETTRAQSDFFLRDSLYSSNIILRELGMALANEENDLTEIFGVSLLNGMQSGASKVWHDNMTPADRIVASLALFHNNGNKTHSKYTGPILSDAPSALLINFKRYETTTALDELRRLASSEYKKMQEQKRSMKKLSPRMRIKNYETEEPQYTTMSMFNGFKGDPGINTAAADELLKKWLSERATELHKSMVASEVLIYTEKGKLDPSSRVNRSIMNEKNMQTYLERFFVNDFLTNASFSLLTIGDPSFYATGNDSTKSVNYAKRGKQIYSPKFIGDIDASYTTPSGETITVGSQFTTAYLDDSKLKAPSIDGLAVALEQSVKSGYMNNDQVSAIIDKFSDIVETDGQAYTGLKFYRKTMISLGRWNDSFQAAYDRLELGLGTANDIMKVMQPIKPFSYGMIYDEKRKRLIPVQHKNSEYLLLPQIALATKGGEYVNPILAELYTKMNSNNIDVVNFVTAVKVGSSNTTTISELSKDNIHVIPMDNRGIQMETPEHFIDESNIFGIQIRKLIMADLNSSKAPYMIDGKLSKTAEELHSLYESILLADLVESYDGVKSKFLDDNGEIDKKKISALLIAEANSRGKEPEYIAALQIGADGEFITPLFHPLHARTSQSLLNSIFRSRITKQKINGGSFIQASSYGLSRKLEIVFDTKENRDKFETTGLDENTETYTGGLMYMEALLPAWSSSFFSDFVDDDGNIDFELAKQKLPSEIFDMVGYRIPTEDKYSMIPIRVVGFLPIEAGGAIMLPAEISTISGSDFDVDKLYLMMKAFSAEKITKKVVKKRNADVIYLEKPKINAIFVKNKDIMDNSKNPVLDLEISESLRFEYGELTALLKCLG